MRIKQSAFTAMCLILSTVWLNPAVAQLSEFQARHGDLVQTSQQRINLGGEITGLNFAPPREIDKAALRRQGNTQPATPATAGEQPARIPTQLLATDLTTGSQFKSYDLSTASSIVGYLYTPPDTMGAVGPTQFWTVQNGLYRIHDKLTGLPDVGLDVIANVFWPVSVDPNDNAGGDPRVRFDRLTNTWILSAFTRETSNNRIVFARSDGPVVSASTVWTYYFLQPGTASSRDNGCFADYPMLGTDAVAILFGANMFPAGACTYPPNNVDTSVWVLPRPALPGGGGDVSTLVTAFSGLLTTNSVWTPMPADNYDPAASTSYWVSANGSSDTILELGTITYPGGTPTLSLAQVTINAKNDGWNVGVPYPGVPAPTGSGASWGLDQVGFRPIGGAIVRDGHLWTTMSSSVQGPAGELRLWPATGDRHSVVFFEVDLATQTRLQEGNIFDDVTGVGAAPRHYFVGSITVNGQGHAVAGFTATNTTTLAPSAAWAGRLAEDPPGQFGSANLYWTGVNTGNMRHNFEASARPTRWGDYTMTSVDPCDDMTFYTIQEYQEAGPVTTGGNWAVAVGRIDAPAPDALLATPAVIPPWSSSTSVVISGTGFYDPPVAGMPPCRQGIAASVTDSIVSDITYDSPTSITLDLDTSAATLGSKTATITNPDGQQVQIGIEVGCSGANMAVANVTVPGGETLTCNVTNIQVLDTTINGTLDITKTGTAALDPNFLVASGGALVIGPP